MNMPRVRVAAIWAISFWPMINFFSRNWHEVADRGLLPELGILGISLWIAIIGNLLHRFASRRLRPPRGGLVVLAWVLAVLLMFGYSTVGAACEILYDHYDLVIPRMAAWLVVVALAVAFVIRCRESVQVQMAAAFFGIFGGGTSLLLLGKEILSYQPPPHDAAVAAASQSFVPKPARLARLNVYYVMLDGYAGARGLTQAVGFDNHEFLARMKARGFVDASTEQSNYLRTEESLGGIFWLDYPHTDDARTWKSGRGLYPQLFDGDYPPALVRRLSAAGYQTWHSATAWGGCAHRYIRCLGDVIMLEANYMTVAFLAPTPFARESVFLAGERDNAFRSITSRLPVLLGAGTPVFVFAHHMSPHPPFAQTETCEHREYDRRMWKDWDHDDREGYLAAVRCVNSQVERLVDILLRQNPEAIIVLQGDHGSAFQIDWSQPMDTWSAASIRERASYLNLVRAPQDCQRWLDRTLGQINTARFVIACIEGRPPDYLPERTYLSTYEGHEKGVVRAAPEGWDGPRRVAR